MRIFPAPSRGPALSRRAVDRLLTDPTAAAAAGHRQLAALLSAAAAPMEAAAVTGEQGALRAYRSVSPAVPIPARGSRMLARIGAAKLAVAATVGGLVLTGGVAAAATGSLPAGVQEKAHDAVAKAGVTIPGPNHHAGNHPAVHAPGDHDGSAGVQGKGSEISKLATTTDTTGVDKGAAVSGAASEGKSEAGEHSPTVAGSPGVANGSTGAAHSSEAKPLVGTGASASNGHSTAGAGNAPTHR